MNRFKTSKFKNTTPKIAKKDGWICNIRGGNIQSQGNHIAASSELVAFNTDQAGGGMLGVTSLNPDADGKWTVSQLPCHGDVVTDLAFSPFEDTLLATCSADETVKLWRLCRPEDEQPGGPELTLSPGQGPLELVLFHPTSSGLLAVGTSQTPLLWDTSRPDVPLAVLEQHSDKLLSLSWKQDGSLLASSCMSAKTMQGNKGMRVLWAREDYLLTVDMNRGREVRLWDSRKLGSSLGSVFIGESGGAREATAAGVPSVSIGDPDTERCPGPDETGVSGGLDSASAGIPDTRDGAADARQPVQRKGFQAFEEP
ncbi:hypothetical protein NHX12_032660, partial [Muraenolepis orangiensis]